MDEQAAHEALEEVAAPGAGNDGRSWAHQHVMRDVMNRPRLCATFIAGRYSKALAGPRPLDRRQAVIGRGDGLQFGAKQRQGP